MSKHQDCGCTPQRSAQTAKIIARGVGKGFKDRKGHTHTILSGLKLEVKSGELICLLGPNGCGKTTFLNLLAGFSRPDEGEILIEACPVTAPRPEYVMIMQSYDLFPWRTVLGNVEYGLEMQGMNKIKRQEKAKALIALVGLSGCEEQYPRELSGGMRQRVAIARALAVEPQILFMDEPFGALDALTRAKMQQELLRLWQEREMTIIFVTHDINESIQLADRIAVLPAKPGPFRAILQPTLPRPRDPRHPDCMNLRDKLERLLLPEGEAGVEHFRS